MRTETLNRTAYVVNKVISWTLVAKGTGLLHHFTKVSHMFSLQGKQEKSV
jgi:hypothetical protein